MNNVSPVTTTTELTYVLAPLVGSSNGNQPIQVKIKKTQVRDQIPNYEISITGLLPNQLTVTSEVQQVLRGILAFYDSPSF